MATSSAVSTTSSAPAGSSPSPNRRRSFSSPCKARSNVAPAALIPPRYRAQRPAGNPLAALGGAPMVGRGAQRAARAEGVDEVAGATDDERIARAVRQAGFRALRTDPACRNGTERIAQAARDLQADGYLNVQGAEPLAPPGAITARPRLVPNA